MSNEAKHTPRMERPWMRDGKPGAILAALHAAAASAGSLDKHTEGGMSYTNIDDVRAVAARVCDQHGIVVIPRMLDCHVGVEGKAPMATATIELDFIAHEDGSMVTATLTGAGQAGMGRSLTVATTAAVKQALVTVLQISTKENDLTTRPGWTPKDASDAAHEWWARIRASPTIDALKEALPSPDIRDEEELAHGRAIYKTEMDRLRTIAVAESVEPWRERELARSQVKRGSK